MRIITACILKPMRVRDFDWEAIDDETYDVGEPIGYGATESEAILDLKQKLEERRA